MTVSVPANDPNVFNTARLKELLQEAKNSSLADRLFQQRPAEDSQLVSVPPGWVWPEHWLHEAKGEKS